ncbi:hypothetical protein [Spiribacter onubensis]|uniref:Glycosyl transferase n=1 Tax=Spiribacter onubensis TaxID=3122420 RepID=A0ABV3SBC3_9GAMM
MKTLKKKVGKVEIYARSRTMSDLAELMSLGLSKNQEIESSIYVGAHEWRFSRIKKKRISIGVQTEQFYDSNNERLWGLYSEYLPLLYCSKYDYVLDLSLLNRPAYERFELRNVIFGPYIFHNAGCLKIGKSPHFSFVGDVSPRRKKFLEELNGKYHLINGGYEEIKPELIASEGLLNIHHKDGDYIEWPRFLLAYDCGKIVFSEALPGPLVKNLHYAPFGEYASVDSKMAIFEGFKKDVATKYNLDRFFLAIDLTSARNRKPKILRSYAILKSLAFIFFNRMKARLTSTRNVS